MVAVGRARVAVALVAAGLLAGSAAPTAYATRSPALDRTRELRQAVDVDGILAHQRQFQRIANDSKLFGTPTRAAGTRGYDRSVRYVTREMREAGYQVTVQQFTIPFFVAANLSLTVAPKPTGFTGTTSVYLYSGGGRVSGRVQPVDVVVPIGHRPANTSTSGCEASDFTGFTRGSIALLQRGTCRFEQKVDNAVAAGAAGVLIFNEGQPGRDGPYAGSVATPKSVPVFGLTYADGAALVQQVRANTATTAKLSVTVEADPARTTYNVLAQTRHGNPNNVVMAGAHLDSVFDGPGINDNGSGSATLLEVARELARSRTTPKHMVRFAWWGGEELGLLGSAHYVRTLPPAQRAAIAAYLNFDMVGSPNFVRLVYDGDNSLKAPGAAVGPPGSAAIERLFTDYFTALGLPAQPTPFDGRSDYGPFIAAGIPAGGLFTGAEDIKTEAQARVFGGRAGQAYDACYHERCDTAANLSRRALNEMSDAVAHAVLTFALDTSTLAGRRAA